MWCCFTSFAINKVFDPRGWPKNPSEKKAFKLFFGSISRLQRRNLVNNGFIEVRGSDSKDIYRLKCNSFIGNIFRQKNGETLRLCCYPTLDNNKLAPIPIFDNLFTQKFMIEHFEKDFLEKSHILEPSGNNYTWARRQTRS